MPDQVESEIKPKVVVTRDNAKARVYVLYTGGTIGMVPSDPENSASPLKPAEKEELLKYVPGLGEAEGIYWEIEGLFDSNGEKVPPLDSSDVEARHWLYMASAIEKVYKDYDGFVILHGTDTMAYTASGLSFLLQNLAKPVVITGGQLPIAKVRTDSVQNFVNALYIAAYKATGLPLVPEVTICFGDSLLRGNRVRKMSTSSWQGFGTPNYPKLGTIGEHIKINEEFVLPPHVEDFFAHKALNTDVLDVGIFPGLKPLQLGNILEIEGVAGIVLRTFGAGNAPSDDDFVDRIGDAIDKGGKVIVNVTQCPEGMVEMGLYAASSKLQERGVISGLDMTPEAALAKLMWILMNESGEEIKTQFQIDQRGEQSESLFDVRYGSGGLRSQPLDLAKASASPAGKFRKARLSRAVLRVSGLGVTGLKEGERLDLRAFINLPAADANTSEDDPHFAAHFTQIYAGPNETVLVEDVTPTVRRVIEDGRAVNVTLVPADGKKIWYRGLYLALFTKV